MFNTTFVVVMTIVLAIVILICIGVICTLVQQIKEKQDGFCQPIILILLAVSTIIMVGMAIALLNGWGDPQMLQNYMVYDFFAMMAIGVVFFIIFGVSFFKIGKN